MKNHKESFPRVLVIGQFFSYQNGGGGITLCNLFKGWPKENLASLPYSFKDVVPSICINYYRLGENEKSAIYPVLYSKCKVKSKSYKIESSESINKQKSLTTSSIPVGRMLKTIKNTIVNKFGLYHNSYKIELSDQLISWINDFEPDIIYSQYSTYQTMKFIRKIKTHFDIPLVVHFMDDWITVLNKENFLKNYWQKKIDYEFKKLLKIASLRLTISEAMKLILLLMLKSNGSTIHTMIKKYYLKGKRKIT